MRRLNGGMILSWLLQEKLRLIAIVITLLIAMAASSWLTPYKSPPQTQFLAESQVQTTQLRAEVTEVDYDSGKAKVLDGPQKGQILPIEFYGFTPAIGSTVLLNSNTTAREPNPVSQPWRIPALIWLIAVMVVLVIIVGGRQGVMSLAGLAISICVVVWYIVPQVTEGSNALIVSAIGAFAIASISIIVAHGSRWRTLVSLLSIYLLLALVILFAWLAGHLAALTGVYDETSSLLRSAPQSGQFDLYGILLGGIIIASLGVLDDVVTTQVAAVDELRLAKPHAGWKELFSRGMSVGREHLSALINTLALAYVGVALPTIIIMSQMIVAKQQQLTMALNYEYISIEIVRTVVSSTGIILAIPLSTALAVVMISKKQEIIGILRRVQPKTRR